MKGLWPSNTRLFIGEFDHFVVGVRKDVTFEMFREGVIQDNTGAIVFNLLQQDMSAMRVTFRAGWQVANPINNEQTDRGEPLPGRRAPQLVRRADPWQHEQEVRHDAAAESGNAEVQAKADDAARKGYIGRSPTRTRTRRTASRPARTARRWCPTTRPASAQPP
jgi:hypothetical protein